MSDAKTLEALISKVEALIAEEESTVTSYAAADSRLDTLEAELAAERAKREEIERQLELQVVGQTLDEIHSFADRMVGEGKVSPAMKSQIATLLSVTANLEGNVASYALGDAGEEGEKAPYALLMDILENLPVQNQFRRVSKDADAAAKANGKYRNTDMRRFASDADAAEELHERVKAVQARQGISYLQAYEQVNRELIEAQG